ncbi:MAG: XamI family restriction endonuclease [Rhodomicrobium sp.]
MTLSNASRTPRVWSDDELAQQAEIALNEFADRRLAKPGGRYLAHVQSCRQALFRLFEYLGPIDPQNPSPETVRTILLDNDLFAALRYVAGPPVSEDDLKVLVTRSTQGFGKTELRKNDALVKKVLALICKLADPYRFSWISAKRAPSPSEIRRAIAATTILHASQRLQTERRGYGRKVEQRLEARLVELFFTKVPKPNKGKIRDPIHYPTYPNFYDECVLHGRKTDLLVALPNRRLVAIEAKDSSSTLNSIKRVLNDTAAKARHFHEEGGKNIIPVALLSGVFDPQDLRSAQDTGLYLVWAHDLDGFVEWIKSQT